MKQLFMTRSFPYESRSGPRRQMRNCNSKKNFFNGRTLHLLCNNFTFLGGKNLLFCEKEISKSFYTLEPCLTSVTNLLLMKNYSLDEASLTSGSFALFAIMSLQKELNDAAHEMKIANNAQQTV